MVPGSRIAGVGIYLPRTVVPNSYFAPLMGEKYSDLDSFFDGQTQRRHAAPDETSVFMGTEAAREALERAQLKPQDIDCVLSYSGAPDYRGPTDGAWILEKLGINRVTYLAFDMQCASFIAMLGQADLMIRAGKARNVLILTMCNWVHREIDQSRNFSMVGDGAGAAVLTPSDKPSLLAAQQRIFPEHVSAISLPGPTPEVPWPRISHQKATPEFRDFMLGGAVLEAPRECILECRSRNIDVHWALFGQPGRSAMQAWAHGLEIPWERVLTTVEVTGNLAAVNQPAILHQFLYSEPRIQRGDHLLMFAPAAGMNSYSLVWRY